MKFIILFTILVFAIGCKKDPSPEPYRPRDIREVFLEDEAEIQTYLETHFYNYIEFQNPSGGFDYVIRLDTIAGNNASKTPLKNQIETAEITVGDVPHKLYYLIAKHGEGRKPSVVDSVFITYKGQRLDGKRFDFSNVPIWLDLSSSVRGFREGLSKIASGATNIGVNTGNGNYQLPTNGGVGFIIFPSGLGYFDGASANIPSYTPLIFTFSTYLTAVTDHDRDGINSINEDPNSDGNPLNDDTDGDGLPNFKDKDDDNDGTLTKDEYDVHPKDGIPDDKDNDGVPDI